MRFCNFFGNYYQFDHHFWLLNKILSLRRFLDFCLPLYSPSSKNDPFHSWNYLDYTFFCHAIHVLDNLKWANHKEKMERTCFLKLFKRQY